MLTRNVNVHGNDPVASSDHRVAVMIISTAVCAASHRYHPPRMGHLIVNLPQSRCHFIRQCTSDNNNVSLSGGGSEDHTKPVHVVTWCGDVHHLHGTTREAKGQRPHGTLATPVQDVVQTGHYVFSLVLWLKRTVGLLLCR